MKQWKTVIEPKTKLLDLPWKEIWQYRHLVWMLVKRNYEIQYKQTILGPWWIILNPVFSSGLFSLIFGVIGRFQSDGLPYFLFYLSGNIIWMFFYSSVTLNATIFLDNAYLFGKVYFPRMAVPIATVLFEMIRFMIQFAVCIFVWLFFYMEKRTEFGGMAVLLLPVLIIETGILGMSLGMIISSLTTKYRDFNHITGFAMQLFMYVSPVLYSINGIPDTLQRIILLNPMASVIEAFRYAITGSGIIRWHALLYSLVVTGILAIVGMVVFHQTEKTFIDIV